MGSGGEFNREHVSHRAESVVPQSLLVIPIERRAIGEGSLAAFIQVERQQVGVVDLIVVFDKSSYESHLRRTVAESN